MALRVPSGMAAWPLLPQPRTQTVPASSPGSRVMFSAGSRPSARTSAAARSGTALKATPPSKASTWPPHTGLTRSARKWPFSPLQTGNSASGLKQKSGARLPAR